jgi:hypothetical protein
MTRASDDKTSTCETCNYFALSAPDGGRPDGYCQWVSIPAWAQRTEGSKPVEYSRSQHAIKIETYRVVATPSGGAES